jgi:hypothetical protein
MMATPHMLAGGALGRVLRRPWLAYPAAFASHFVLDVVPHIDAHGLFGVPGGGLTPPEAVTGFADAFVGATVVALLAARQPVGRVILGGAVFGVLMDLVEYVPPFSLWFGRLAVAAPISAFHHGIQHNVDPSNWPLGVATQAAVVALSLALLWPRRRRNGRLARGIALQGELKEKK